MIEGARTHGIDVSTEVYPCTAASTRSGSALFDAGWQGRIGGQYGDIEWPETGERLVQESFDRYRRNPQTFVVIHTISARTVDIAIAHPLVMIESDGVPFVNGAGYPRGAGTFARVLGHYVRWLATSLASPHTTRRSLARSSSSGLRDVGAGTSIMAGGAAAASSRATVNAGITRHWP